MITKHEFALQWLDYLGVKIYNKGKQIFLYDGKSPFEINPYGMLDTKISCGKALTEEDENEVKNYTILSFPDLNSMGYTVFADKNVNFFWWKGQRVFYRIIRLSYNTYGMNYDAFRRVGLHIQHDPKNKRFRLLGDNALADPDARKDAGVGPWIIYDDDSPLMNAGNVSGGRELTIEESRALLHGEVSEFDSTKEFQSVNEIPAIITDEGYIVCIKKQDTCQRIIVVGESRQGKSLFCDAISGRIFYIWQNRVGILIDTMNQFQDMGAPQDFDEFIKMNNLINNPPTPLPIVPLHMASADKVAVKHPKVSLVLVANIVEVMYKYKLYSYGIDDWQIKGSTRYLYQYIHKIKNAKNAEDFCDVMSQEIPGYKEDKNAQSMVGKWSSSFDLICKEKFTSNMYLDDINATDELTVIFPDGEKITTHPFIALMEAGAIPEINVSGCKTKKWLRNYLADLENKIMLHQMQRGDKKVRIYLLVDEGNEIIEMKKFSDFCSKNMESIFRQGGFNHIGFIFNTQSLAKLNQEMYNNATHLCCVYMKDPKDRKRLRDTFGVDNDVDEVMRNLKKKEMMIFTKEPVVIYDRWGRRKEVDDRIWWKGKIVPPINYHAMPKG